MTESLKNLATALAKAQGVIENAKKGNLNPHFKSRYADLASVWDEVREPFTSNGLSVVQLPCEAPAGFVGLETTILHSSGETIAQKFFMPLAKDRDPQAVGSAITYAKRYALLGAAGIAPEDDDGNAATARPARPTAVSSQEWDTTTKLALSDLAGCKTETEMRTLYSKIRGSSIDEPHKTLLLTQMGIIIKERLSAAGKK